MQVKKNKDIIILWFVLVIITRIHMAQLYSPLLVGISDNIANVTRQMSLQCKRKLKESIDSDQHLYNVRGIIDTL